MGGNNKPILITLGAIAVVIAGYLIYVAVKPAEPAAPQMTRQPAAPPIETPKETVMPEPEAIPNPMEEAAEPAPARAETTPAFTLPRLGDSDPLFRDGVASLTDRRGIDHWLAGSDLIRRFVAVVDNIAKGRVQRQNLGFMSPDEPISVKRLSDETYVFDEASYRRFDLVTDIFASIDSERAAEFYSLLRPLFQEAYEELGYSNRRFDDVIFVAIGRLLETPDPAQPVNLVRPTVMYQFADRRLESLSDAQKQLLRMGPRNARIVKAKLSELALQLRTLLSS